MALPLFVSITLLLFMCQDDSHQPRNQLHDHVLQHRKPERAQLMDRGKRSFETLHKNPPRERRPISAKRPRFQDYLNPPTKNTNIHPVSNIHPLSIPPLSTPPLSTPPRSTPPLSTPPRSTPPHSTPPRSNHPLRTPPLCTPPVFTPFSALRTLSQHNGKHSIHTKKPPVHIRKPHVHIRKPSVPLRNPSKPIRKPSEPIRNPSEPIRKPLAPNSQWLEHKNNPSEHTEKSSQRTEKPSERTERPSERTKKSSEHYQKPSELPNKPSEQIEQPSDHIGKRISVYWPMELAWFDGILTRYMTEGEDVGAHEVVYDDGAINYIDLKDWTWKVLGPTKKQAAPATRENSKRLRTYSDTEATKKKSAPCKRPRYSSPQVAFEPAASLPHVAAIKLFQCKTCRKFFNNKIEFTFHQEQHRQLLHQAPPRFVSIVSTLPIKLLRCKTCRKVFNNRTEFMHHKEQHKRLSIQFECSFCLATFRQKHAFEMHKLMHAGGNPFYCEFCNRRFSQINDVERHEVEEHPDKCFLLTMPLSGNDRNQGRTAISAGESNQLHGAMYRDHNTWS